MRSALLVSFALAAAGLPAQDREFGVPVRTTLAEMRANPGAFHNVKVIFTVQFASLGRIANPFFTKFTPTEFANFYAWGDEQPIWREPAYNDVCGTLFLSKSSPLLEKLYTMRVYQRTRIIGVVRNTFQDMPWIEVLEFEGQSGQVDTALLTHLHRGEQLMEQRLWSRAITELALVPGKGVPSTPLTAAHKNLGTCLLRIGEPEAAMSYLASASKMGKGQDLEVESLIAMASSNPSKMIDRTVDASKLHDSERPMWEAFADNTGDQPTTRVLER